MTTITILLGDLICLMKCLTILRGSGYDSELCCEVVTAGEVL